MALSQDVFSWPQLASYADKLATDAYYQVAIFDITFVVSLDYVTSLHHKLIGQATFFARDQVSYIF